MELESELLMLQEELKLFSDSIALNQVPIDSLGECVFEDTIVRPSIDLFQGTLKDFLKQNRGKKYFMYMGAIWCGPCKKIKKTTFKDSLFISYYDENMQGIELDMDSFTGLEISQKYKVNQIPHFLFFNHRGVLVGRIEGYMDTYSFIKKINSFY